MPKLEIPHKIISLNVLATGRMILTTENRVYESLNDVWTPMKFADDPEPAPEATPAPTAPAETPSIFAPAAPVEPTTETHS